MKFKLPFRKSIPIEQIAREEAQLAVRAAMPQATRDITEALSTLSPDLTPVNLTGSGGWATRPPLYHWDNPWQFYTPQAPTRHPGSVIDVRTMRALAENYDILRDCINHLKRELTAVPLQITSVDENDDSESTKRAVAEVVEFFSEEGGLGGLGYRRSHFEAMYFEDVLVIGAGAIFCHPTKGGGLYQAIPIDASTIRPRVDVFGWPGPTDDHFEQWIMGLKVGQFTRDVIRYDGLYPVTNSPYYKSSVEWLIQVINAALSADTWNLSWLTDGTTVSDMVALPESMSPDQVKEWSDWWDMMITGNMKQRAKTKWVPAGSQRVGSPSRKDNEFQEFMMWLMKRTCAIYGVAPASIGFAGEQYKVTQEGSRSATSHFGAGSLLDFRKATYDWLIQRRLGYSQVQAVNVTSREITAKERAEVNQIYVNCGILTRNEVRDEEGKGALPGGDILLVDNKLVPLDLAANPPDPAAALGIKPEKPESEKVRAEALRLWEKKCINRLKDGKQAACSFEHEALPPEIVKVVQSSLEYVTTIDMARTWFKTAIPAIIDDLLPA